MGLALWTRPSMSSPKSLELGVLWLQPSAFQSRRRLPRRRLASTEQRSTAGAGWAELWHELCSPVRRGDEGGLP